MLRKKHNALAVIAPWSVPLVSFLTLVIALSSSAQRTSERYSPLVLTHSHPAAGTVSNWSQNPSFRASEAESDACGVVWWMLRRPPKNLNAVPASTSGARPCPEMEAILTASIYARLLLPHTSITLATRAWHMRLPLPVTLSSFWWMEPMQRTADTFAVGYVLPILLALSAALRLGRGFAHAGVQSHYVTIVQLALLFAAVPLHVLAVHGAALDLVAGSGWERLVEVMDGGKGCVG